LMHSIQQQEIAGKIKSINETTCGVLISTLSLCMIHRLTIPSHI
jgi:hypothetical protein